MTLTFLRLLLNTAEIVAMIGTSWTLSQQSNTKF